MVQRRIEILILLFTFALIMAVAVIGAITFNNLRVIERQSEKIIQPNQTVLFLKALLSELRNSENCVRSYGLYNKAEYLQNYEYSLHEVDRCFDSLFSYQRDDNRMMALLDSTEDLVEQKIFLLNKQLSLRNEQPVLNEVNRINRKLDALRRLDTVIITPKNIAAGEVAYAAVADKKKKERETTGEKKRNFFSRLFHRKEAKKKHETGISVDPKQEGDLKAATVDCVRVVLNRGSVEDIKSEVRRVKRNQTSMFSKMKEEELKLVEEDKLIWSQLLEILARLERVQTELLRGIASDNIQMSGVTHRYTMAFGLLILFMLGFLGCFSVYYFYKVREHRNKLGLEMEKSRNLARAKEIFLANMSHEMRTPLNAITGFAEQLRYSELNDEQRKQLSIISSASSHLLNLINDVLDLSKIEADKIQFENIAFSPADQIRGALDILQPKALHKNLSVVFSVADGIPASLSGDPLRLRQVILNLFGNAIKFTDQGEIKIRVWTEKNANGLDPQKIDLNICVEDSGIGISEEMQEKVFENFTQADSSISRKFGGTGLGLSITKKIVELQGGKINLQSRLNGGTKITVTIPYAIRYSESVSKPESADSVEASNTRGKKVLIADDELFNRILLITILRRWGMEYDEVQNGREVLQKVEQSSYDLILMDVRMPEISGIDATRAIRAMSDAKKAAVPIVALTAATAEEKREQCLEAGMTDLLTKPYNEKDLMRLIEKIFSEGTKDA